MLPSTKVSRRNLRGGQPRANARAMDRNPFDHAFKELVGGTSAFVFSMSRGLGSSLIEARRSPTTLLVPQRVSPRSNRARGSSRCVGRQTVRRCRRSGRDRMVAFQNARPRLGRELYSGVASRSDAAAREANATHEKASAPSSCPATKMVGRHRADLAKKPVRPGSSVSSARLGPNSSSDRVAAQRASVTR